MKKARPIRTKQALLAELRTLSQELNQVNIAFKGINKRAKTLLKKAHASSDSQTAAAIRKQMGL